MNEILTISKDIIIIWWAIIMILGVIISLLVIKILLKIDFMVKDAKQKYELVTWFMFKPFNVVNHFISKLTKNG